jgi:hypothetical protein
MMTKLRILALLFLLSMPAQAEEHGFQDALLDKMVGEWVMTGTIAGDQVTHDLVAEWVLEHCYLRFHEISRGVDSTGTPLYEAIVFIDWDKATSQYACLWLDSTGGGGIASKVLGYAKRDGDTLPFMFNMGDGGAIYNTFTYRRESDDWTWRIDIENDGKTSRFADVVLTRK